MTAVCWFRTDLRVDDQPALAAAAALGPTIGLFIASPEQWSLHHDAPIKIDFWLRAVKHLRIELEALNIPLKILVVDRWKDVPAALLSFCQRHNVEQVHCNREYGVNERNRDRASYSLLAQHNIALQGHHGGTLLIPGSVKTGAAAYYRVFTPFAKACREKLRSAPYRLTPGLKKQSAAGMPSSDDFPKVLTALLGVIPEGLQRAWPATPAAALERLDQFAQTRMAQYQPDRDFPAIPGTSVLSPYLAAGLISAGQCLHAALVQNQGESDTGQRGIVVWINELLWREFYQHLLFGYPALSMHQPMRY